MQWQAWDEEKGAFYDASEAMCADCEKRPGTVEWPLGMLGEIVTVELLCVGCSVKRSDNV